MRRPSGTAAMNKLVLFIPENVGLVPKPPPPRVPQAEVQKLKSSAEKLKKDNKKLQAQIDSTKASLIPSVPPRRRGLHAAGRLRPGRRGGPYPAAQAPISGAPLAKLVGEVSRGLVRSRPEAAGPGPQVA